MPAPGVLCTVRPGRPRSAGAVDARVQEIQGASAAPSQDLVLRRVQASLWLRPGPHGQHLHVHAHQRQVLDKAGPRRRRRACGAGAERLLQRPQPLLLVPPQPGHRRKFLRLAPLMTTNSFPVLY